MGKKQGWGSDTAARVWRAGRWCGVFGFLCLALLAAAGAADLAAAPISPHKASYELRLQRAEASSGIVGASGRIEFEWADACSGWIVSQKTKIAIDRSDGGQATFGWSLNSWEAKDGLSYRFFIRESQGGQVTMTRGKARLDGPGGSGVASFTLPAERDVALPQGAVFPTQHSLTLIEAALGQGMPFWRVVFDGTGDDGLAAVNATLIRQFESGVVTDGDWPLLRHRESWRLSLAFFTLAEDASAPEHEQGLRLFNNGVVDQLTLNYGDFTLEATLRDLTALPAPDC